MLDARVDCRVAAQASALERFSERERGGLLQSYIQNSSLHSRKLSALDQSVRLLGGCLLQQSIQVLLETASRHAARENLIDWRKKLLKTIVA